MEKSIEIIDFGLQDYGVTLDIQKNLFSKLIEAKRGKKGEKEYLLLGEHPDVITLGRRAQESNVLYPEKYLKKKGIGIYHIGRGGDVTFHCPGQLIAYPILDLDKYKLGVKEYVNLLEEAVIRLLEKYGVKGERVEGATGVWIEKDTPKERKICAIGVKCSFFCSMHGLALNINSDLTGFQLINPCGFKDKGVTSLQIETGEKIDMEKLKVEFSDIFLSLIFSFKEVLDLSEKL